MTLCKYHLDCYKFREGEIMCEEYAPYCRQHILLDKLRSRKPPVSNPLDEVEWTTGDLGLVKVLGGRV
jgi:hypothetical protein